MSKLSIITINFNNLEGLQKTIDSVISQTEKDFEWIIIDGGSNDGSKELIELYRDYFSYWCSEPDNGIYNAMNKGIAHAKGDYLQFLNSGDILKDEMVIKKILPYLQGGDIYMANMYFSTQIGVPAVKPDIVQPQNILHTLVFGAILHPVSYFKRNCFDKLGNYNEDFRIVSDWWFFFQAIVLYNYSITYISEIAVIFDETGISSTHPSLAKVEKNCLWKCRAPLGELVQFYEENYDIIKSLKSNKFIFTVFRLYFFLYRHLTFLRK